MFKCMPATSVFTDKTSRKYIRTREKKKVPKAIGQFALRKALILRICYIIFNKRPVFSSKAPHLVVYFVSHSAYFLWMWTRFCGGTAAAEPSVFIPHPSYSVWQSRLSSPPSAKWCVAWGWMYLADQVGLCLLFSFPGCFTGTPVGELSLLCLLVSNYFLDKCC